MYTYTQRMPPLVQRLICDHDDVHARTQSRQQPTLPCDSSSQWIPLERMEQKIHSEEGRTTMWCNVVWARVGWCHVPLLCSNIVSLWFFGGFFLGCFCKVHFIFSGTEKKLLLNFDGLRECEAATNTASDIIWSGVIAAVVFVGCRRRFFCAIQYWFIISVDSQWLNGVWARCWTEIVNEIAFHIVLRECHFAEREMVWRLCKTTNIPSGRCVVIDRFSCLLRYQKIQEEDFVADFYWRESYSMTIVIPILSFIIPIQSPPFRVNNSKNGWLGNESILQRHTSKNAHTYTHIHTQTQTSTHQHTDRWIGSWTYGGNFDKINGWMKFGVSHRSTCSLGDDERASLYSAIAFELHHESVAQWKFSGFYSSNITTLSQHWMHEHHPDVHESLSVLVMALVLDVLVWLCKMEILRHCRIPNTTLELCMPFEFPWNF